MAHQMDIILAAKTWLKENRGWRRRLQIKHAKFRIRVAQSLQDQPGVVFWRHVLRRVDYDAADKMWKRPYGA